MMERTRKKGRMNAIVAMAAIVLPVAAAAIDAVHAALPGFLHLLFNTLAVLSGLCAVQV